MTIAHNFPINIFNFNFVGQDRDGPVFSVKPNQWSMPIEVRGTVAQAILNKKKLLWRQTGRMSHSDVAFVGANILTSPQGKPVVEILVRRFPLIIADELQDTGWFLGRIIKRLFVEPSCKGLAVGDPDQAIYEFNGARPEIFEKFLQLPSARPFELNTSKRCPGKICKAAEALSSSRTIKPPQDREGEAIIAVYEANEDEVLGLCERLHLTDPASVCRLLVRKNLTIRKLKGSSKSAPLFGSRPIQMLFNAVNLLELGQMRRSIANGEAALATILFSTEAPTEDDIRTLKLTPFEWRKQVVQLLRAVQAAPRTTLYEWGCNTRDLIDEALTKQNWLRKATNPRRLKRPNRKTKNQKCSRHFARKGGTSVHIHTVHGVKGETHDTTIYLVPKPSRNSPCISEVWFSKDTRLQEERRIAFVASTRARRRFILCLHADTFQNLRRNQPSFVANFEVKSVQELLKRYA